MVRLFNAICLLGLAAVAAAAPYDQETQMKDATCDNNCFFQFFTNKCNADNKACACTLNDMRANYFCCLAKNCTPHVLPDAIGRVSDDCVAWKLPFGPFDAEATCGIKLPASTTSVPSTPKSTSSPDSTPAASSSSSAVVSSTAAPAPTVATSSNSTASATTGGSSVGATTSAGAAATTVPVKAGGSRTTLQIVPVVLGLGALVAALL